MSDQGPRPPATRAPTLDELRRETLQQLEGLRSRLDPDDYDRRIEVARRATDETELAAVRPGSADDSQLAPANRPAPPRPGPLPDLPLEEERGFVFACMGGSMRKGQWEPPEILYALALMGGVELDFREADLLEGTSEVVVFACMGGVKIVVPDDVDVEVNGIGLMGGFEHVARHEPGADRPLIRIRGLALMGGVSVKVKPAPGSRTRRVRKLAQKVRNLV